MDVSYPPIAHTFCQSLSFHFHFEIVLVKQRVSPRVLCPSRNTLLKKSKQLELIFRELPGGTSGGDLALFKMGSVPGFFRGVLTMSIVCLPSIDCSYPKDPRVALWYPAVVESYACPLYD